MFESAHICDYLEVRPPLALSCRWSCLPQLVPPAAAGVLAGWGGEVGAGGRAGARDGCRLRRAYHPGGRALQLTHLQHAPDPRACPLRSVSGDVRRGRSVTMPEAALVGRVAYLSSLHQMCVASSRCNSCDAFVAHCGCITMEHSTMHQSVVLPAAAAFAMRGLSCSVGHPRLQRACSARSRRMWACSIKPDAMTSPRRRQGGRPGNHRTVEPPRLVGPCSLPAVRRNALRGRQATERSHVHPPESEKGGEGVECGTQRTQRGKVWPATAPFAPLTSRRPVLGTL